MKVSLIDFTGFGHLDPYFAAKVLIFTKNTRLNMDAAQWHDVSNLSSEEINKQLEYMANTIPSSWEFVSYTFMVEGVTRACTHQMVRTRTASFAQQSMRVTDMSGFKFRVPPNLNDNTEALLRYVSAMEEIDHQYRFILDAGSAEEDARGVLPTNILTNIIGKYNLRTMSDLIKSREGGRTQDEYREVVRAMGDEILRVHPWANLFLYPKGRDYWKELEENVSHIRDADLRKNVLKVIDKMRKS